MKAIGISQYGPVSNFESREVPDPPKLKERQMLVEVKAMSVNPIDVKVRNGTYDDAPDFYDHVPKPFHIIGPDGAGVVLDIGPDVTYFKPGDEIFFGVLPTFQGNAAERVIVSEYLAGHRPRSFDFAEAAALTITYGTAYEAIVERLGVSTGEQAGILIINGAGGVGSMASQIARYVLELPVVVTTASRPETIKWTENMGATHVLDHRKDLKAQVNALKLDVPIRYIFILHSTSQYLSICAEICEPLGKICSIVQSQELNFYGTKFLSKSLTFVWCWLGTRAYHQHDRDAQHRMLEDCARCVDEGKIRTHLTRRLKLTKEGLMEAHRAIESNTTIGKISLSIDEAGDGELFA